MKDIVFLNPPLSQEERYSIKFKAGGQTPPTGLAILAAVVREKGYSTAIVDGAALNLDFNETVDKLLNHNPKYIGITAVTISIFNAVEVAKLIKQKNKRVKIILGGPHLTAAPMETLKRFGKFFDIGVLGEGELTLIELLDTLEKNKNLSRVKGIIYKNTKNKHIINKPRESIKDLDSLPFPAWDLLPNLAKFYCPPAHTLKRLPAALLIPSRGCPGQCVFCDNKVFGRIFRSHSADYIIKMIKKLQKDYGIKEIQFRDDNLLVFRKMLTELCNKIIEQKIDIKWSCAGRVDMVNFDILKLMKKAGCWQIWYGCESGSDKILKEIKKYTTVEKIKNAINLTKKAEISPCGFFMIGMPKETEEDIKKTISLLLELPLDEFHISHLTPFPGSEFYDTASKYGWFDNDWKKMSGWQILFVPKGLTKERLTYYSNQAFRKFYFRPRIILSYIKKITSIKNLKVYSLAFLGFLEYTFKKER